MKRQTDKQKQLLAELAPQIAEYRSLQAKADSVEVVDYESAEIARCWQSRANDALTDLEYYVSNAYMLVPYRRTRNDAIDAFMKLVMEMESE